MNLNARLEKAQASLVNVLAIAFAVGLVIGTVDNLVIFRTAQSTVTTDTCR